MSHKATNWLADLPAGLIGNSEFRVLFHLCDCHNPSQGCFPTQEYLMRVTGVSNGTVNNALKSLEAKGVIARKKTWCARTRRQAATHYELGFELPPPQEPSPNSGDGNGTEPTPNSGDGADSKKHPEPSPKNGQSRLQPTGDKPVKEPVKNHARASDAPDPVEFWATKIRSKSFVPSSAVPPQMAREMLDRKVITEELLREAGIAF